jgi:ankyrin repeat protein
MNFDRPFPDSPLHDAVTARDIDTVRALLDQGHDVNALDMFRQTPLGTACTQASRTNRDLNSMMNELVQQTILPKSDGLGEGRPGTSVDRIQKVINRAGSQFRPEAFERMKRSLAGDPNAEPEWKSVLAAIRKGTERCAEDQRPDQEPIEDDTTLVLLLLDRGADIEGAPGANETPLMTAARSGRTGTMRVLIERGAQIDAAGRGIIAETPLTAACASNHLAAARLLIECGANCRQMDGRGDTALHSAARAGSIEIVRMLLSLGMEVVLLSGRGVSPLACAAMSGRTEMVSFLKDKRARIEFLDAVALGDLEAARRLPAPRERPRGWAYPVGRWAARNGNTEALRLLIKSGLQITLDDFEGSGIVRAAIFRGDIEAVKLLVPNGQTLAALDSAPLIPKSESQGDPARRDRVSALHMAVMTRNREMAQTLIRLGADCNATDGLIGTLGAAVQRGDQEMVQLLIDSGADVNGAPGTKMTPLLLAVQHDDLAIVRILLHHGADPSAGDIPAMAIAGNKPEILAVMKQHLGTDLLDLVERGERQAVEARIDQGKPVDLRGEHGVTALMVAAKVGQLDIAADLLDRGADVNAASDHGMTALFYAVSYRQAALVHLLITRGARVDVENRFGQTPVRCAALGGNIKIIEALTEAGAVIGPVEAAALGNLERLTQLIGGSDRVDAAGPDGMTPLMAAASSGRLDCIRFLITHGAELDRCDNDGSTALCCAAARQSIEAVRLLLEAGADVNAAGEHSITGRLRKIQRETLAGDSVKRYWPKWATRPDFTVRGHTPLHSAALLDDPEIARILLDAGAYIEARRGYHESTPLMGAAMLGKLAVVRLLVERGADVHARDLHNETALDHMRSHEKHADVAAFLKATMEAS